MLCAAGCALHRIVDKGRFLERRKRSERKSRWYDLPCRWARYHCLKHTGDIKRRTVAFLLS
jgi:hypothetical protein